MEKKIKHLELIQSVINRMANNSFMLKGWSVTLVVAALALIGRVPDQLYYSIPFIPVFAFWGLDSYYLSQERLYRSLYETVCKLGEEDIDFSLTISTEKGNCSDNNDFWSCFCSKTERYFYIPIAITCIFIYY